MALETLEARLSTTSFLLGERVTEADWRLLPTLVRFDVGYYSAFKCNIKAIRDLSKFNSLSTTAGGHSWRVIHLYINLDKRGSDEQATTHLSSINRVNGFS